MIWYNIVKDGIVFTVWDYRLNHSASFSVDVEVWKVDDTLKVSFDLSKILFALDFLNPWT